MAKVVYVQTLQRSIEVEVTDEQLAELRKNTRSKPGAVRHGSSW